MIYRPDIKPPMWGPLSAVQYAVRHNAEQMGIDPAGIELAYYLWEGAGDMLSLGTNPSRLLYPHWGEDRQSLVTDGSSTFGRFPRNTDKESWGIRLRVNYEFMAWRCIFGADVQNTLQLLGTEDAFKFIMNNVVVFDGPDIGMRPNKINDITLTSDTNGTTTYVNGKTVHQSTRHGLLKMQTLYPWALGAIAWGSSHLKTQFFAIEVYKQKISPKYAEGLYYEPYALLMPVSRPFIFDMAGGGGTLVTALADLRGTIRNNIQRAADLRAAVSTPQSAQADSKAAVSMAVDAFADTLSQVSILQTTQADTKTAISNLLSSTADTKVSVSELQQVTVPADTRVGVSNLTSSLADTKAAASYSLATVADSKTAVSNTFSATADTRTLLSNALAAQADLSAAASNAIAALCDTRVQISGENTVTVSFDTLAQVSNVISAAADSKSGASNTVITASDCRAAVSQLVGAQADSKAGASNIATASADTQTVISGLVQVLARCDTLVSVSNEVASLADLKVIVGPSGIILTTEDIDAIATAVWRKILADETGEGTASQIVQAIRGEAEKARKMQTNKAIISGDGQTVSIYDDDGTTLLHVFTVSGDKLSRTPQ
jgi:hypothetical protein